jgi:hypothetical protein
VAFLLAFFLAFFFAFFAIGQTPWQSLKSVAITTMRRENLTHDEELIGYLRRCNTSLQKNLSVRVIDRSITRASCALHRVMRTSATLLSLMSISIIHLACGMPLIVERMAHLQLSGGQRDRARAPRRTQRNSRGNPAARNGFAPFERGR